MWFSPNVEMKPQSGTSHSLVSMGRVQTHFFSIMSENVKDIIKRTIKFLHLISHWVICCFDGRLGRVLVHVTGLLTFPPKSSIYRQKKKLLRVSIHHFFPTLVSGYEKPQTEEGQQVKKEKGTKPQNKAKRQRRNMKRFIGSHSSTNWRCIMTESCSDKKVI